MTQGIFHSNSFATDLDAKSFASLITRLMPNGTAPLFTISERIRSATATNVEHGYYTKTFVNPHFVLEADIDASQTTLTVGSSEYLVPGQVHRLEHTGENVIINQVVSPTSILVTRGIGGGAAAITIANDNPRAYQVGTAYEEASVRPSALAFNPVRVSNLTQIFRNTWAISGTAEQIKVIAGDTTVSENKTDAAKLHATNIETAAIFGKKSQGTRNGMPFRTMDGLVNIISNLAYYPPSYVAPNVYTAQTAGTDANTLEDYLDPSFNQTTDPTYGNSRVIFAGGTAIRALNQIGMLNGSYELVDGQTNWGLRFKTLTLSRGTFELIEHPLFNSNPDWAKIALSLDIPTINFAYLGNRKTMDRPFSGNPGSPAAAVDSGIDAIGGTLTTELTLECKNPPANAIVKNLTKGLVNA